MNDKEILWRLGQRIKEIRESKGISQVDLAISLGYERSNMSRLESGRVNPRLTTLILVSQELNISISELLDFELE